jgi:NIMA (never in mitosis gene a)-related kinase
MNELSEKERLSALNEIRILASIEHDNIIAYKDAFIDEKENVLCIVMEYAEKGDLSAIIDRNKRNRTTIDETKVWSYLIQMTRGLKALHEMNICHRDLKCANVFITGEGVLKLGDMNVSKINTHGLMKTQTGTPYY